MSIKDVLLKRRGKVIVDSLDTKDNKHTAYIASINANIQSLGYTLSQDLFTALENKDVEYIANFEAWLVAELKKSVGADVEYMPMYPNFPKQVMEMDKLDLYMNAMKHYWNRDVHNGLLDAETFDLDYEKKYRLKLPNQNKELKEIKLGSEVDVEEIMRNLFASNVAYSEQDKEDIATFMQEKKWRKYIPEVMTNKENIAFIMCEALKSTKYLPENYSELSRAEQEAARKKADNKAIKDAYALVPFIKSANDILRVYAGLSDGDISLSRKNSFKSISKKKRRFLLSVLENLPNLEEDMSMRPEELKKMFKFLHVDAQTNENGEVLYPNVSAAINKIRDNRALPSFAARVEDSFKNETIFETVELLKTNPGYFARTLDRVLRECPGIENKKAILSQFEEIAANVDPKILLTLREHFKESKELKPYRVFFPKGNTAKAYCIKNEIPPVEEYYSQMITEICDKALMEIYSKKGKLGKVYISEKLKGYKAPLVLRNLSKGSKTVVRGSKIPTDPTQDILRAFIWWKDDIDNDISAVLFDENWQPVSHISYTELKNKYGQHSGDITHQRDNGYEGECEFIDIDIEKAKEDGIRYVAFEVHNFSNLTFDKSNCKFGYMERTEPFKYETCDRERSMYPNTGEIFEPLTVKHNMDLTAQTTSMVPMIYDTQTREIIWGDIAISGNFALNNVESSLSSATSACYACVNSEAPNLIDVLRLNAMARGELTTNKEEADEVFDLEDGITPYDTDIIVTRFLGKEVDKDSKGYKALEELRKLQLERDSLKSKLDELDKNLSEVKSLYEKLGYLKSDSENGEEK